MRAVLTNLLVALVAALAGAGATTAWHRAAPAPVSAPQPATMRAWLLDHPEELAAAVRDFRAREAGRAVAGNRDAITTPYGNAWAGNPRGDVTVVQYFDYNCGYCRRDLATVRALLAADPKVRVVFRELPVLAESSETAARYSLVAAERGRFHAFHQAVYGGGPVTAESLAAAARAAGLDPADLAAAARAPRIGAELTRNLGMLRTLGLTGTPSWVVGDQVVSSSLTLDQLQAMVADARGRR